MRKLLEKVAGIIVAVAMMFAPMAVVVAPVMLTVSVSEPAWAACDPTTKKDENGEDCAPSDVKPPETTILPNDWGIMEILEMILNVLVYGLGVAAVLGTIIAAIMYLTARDNEQQVAVAKKRLYEVVIGLVAWAVMFAILQWLIPGGF